MSLVTPKTNFKVTLYRICAPDRNEATSREPLPWLDKSEEKDEKIRYVSVLRKNYSN